MLAKPDDHDVSEMNNTDLPTSNSDDTFMTAKVSVVQSRQIRSMSLPTPPQVFLSSTQGLEQSEEHRQQQQPINKVRTYLVLTSGTWWKPGFRLLDISGKFNCVHQWIESNFPSIIFPILLPKNLEKIIKNGQKIGNTLKRTST